MKAGLRNGSGPYQRHGSWCGSLHDGMGRRGTPWMNDTTPTEHPPAATPHRGALSTLIVFYTMGLAGMAFLLGVTTTPVVRRLAQGSKGRPPARIQQRTQPERRLARLTLTPARSVPRRRHSRARRAAAPSPERLRRSSSAARRRAPRVQTARRSNGARKPLRTARRPAARLPQMRIVFVPRRSPDIAWVNPPPASWPKECRPPEPGSARGF
jgi:hypothetical protein